VKRIAKCLIPNLESVFCIEVWYQKSEFSEGEQSAA